jgi:hypothetical protein
VTEKLSCQSCSACCFHFSVDEIEKPFCQWCQYAKPSDGGGCTIYNNRPQACRDYRCAWLISQDRPGQEMPLSMRPDKSKCMFSVSPDNPKWIYCHVFPNYADAWKKGEIWDKIQDLLRRGGTVEVVVGEWRNLLRAGKPVLRFQESVIDKIQKGGTQVDKSLCL